MSIELVTHCWAGTYRLYADALCFHLTSVVEHDPPVDVSVAICFCAEDDLTLKVIRWFCKNTSVNIRAIPMDKERLGRRCFGRDLAAKGTKADFVWFSDVDQVYLDGVLKRLEDMEWPEEEGKPASIIFPKINRVAKHRTVGDALLQGVASGASRLHRIDTSAFTDKKYHRAIGGVQIVKGDFAREHGYLTGSGKIREDGVLFGDFRDDIAYRKASSKHGPIIGVDLPGMYRIRHTEKTHS
jgi:hypothetical protein